MTDTFQYDSSDGVRWSTFKYVLKNEIPFRGNQQKTNSNSYHFEPTTLSPLNSRTNNRIRYLSSTNYLWVSVSIRYFEKKYIQKKWEMWTNKRKWTNQRLKWQEIFNHKIIMTHYHPISHTSEHIIFCSSEWLTLSPIKVCSA